LIGHRGNALCAADRLYHAISRDWRPSLRCWHTIWAYESTRRLTDIIEREHEAYGALCPERDIASQGDTVECARKNLIEALKLFFESADSTEIARRLHSDVFVTQVEVMVG
jgi:predicted RNase H-like HicB family nuclease